MKPKFINYYMNVATETSLLSHCNRRKVGAIIVPNDRTAILSYGYNGQPVGFNNCCEDSDNLTLDTVIHAEANAINFAKAANQPTEEAIIFVTLSPCINCANLIIEAKIKTVYYKQPYKLLEGLNLLMANGITCIQVGEPHES